jgi:hypothetical protein
MRPLSLVVKQGHVRPVANSIPKHIFHVKVMVGLLLRADGVTVSSLANVPILSSHRTLQFLDCLIIFPMMRRLWFGVDDGLLRPPHLEKDMAMEYMLVRISLLRIQLEALERVLLFSLMVGLSIREDIGTGSSHNILSGRPMLLSSTPLLVAVEGIVMEG